MRFRNLKKWTAPDQSKELIYFAQLLEEMLFDYSLDTYKPSALNTSLLCREALYVIEDIESGVIKRPNLDHVLEELTSNLKSDEVAQSLMLLDVSTVLATLQNKTKPLAEHRVVLELLWSQIEMPSYRRRNEELLIEAINEKRDIKAIRALARTYVTTLKNFGFSSKWLHDTTLDFFYTGRNKITGNSAVSEYIEAFNIDRREYLAIFRASGLFRTIADSCEKLNIEVSDNPEGHQDQIAANNFVIGGDETYVVVKKLSEKEPHSARESADARMEVIQTLLTLFHHKEHPSWSDECLLINVENNESKIVSKPVNPMHKCIDLRAQKASKRLNSFISEFSMDHQSFPKFIRSSELHSLALSSESEENQMINLWIALESLVPPSSADRSTIENVIESCTPFFTLNYVNRLLDRFSADLLNWNKIELNRCLRGIAGDNIRAKLAKFLVLDEYAGRRQALDIAIRDFHLLRSRLSYLSYVLADPKNILDLLSSHKQRVGWQMRRIYRARNVIVHSGRTPPYTGTLIENVHDYLDLVMSTLVSLASENGTITSVEQGFKFIEINCSAFEKSLKNMSRETYVTDIDAAIFKFAI